MKKLGLIGFAGSGKSSLLKYAQADGFKTLDTDEMLETDIDITQFVLNHDEIEFRKLERSVIHEALKKNFDVIAFGGGVHAGHDSWENIKRAGISVVFLEQSFERCVERAPERPLLKKTGLSAYRETFKERQEKYRSVSDWVVNVNDKNSEIVWREVKLLWN